VRRCLTNVRKGLPNKIVDIVAYEGAILIPMAVPLLQVDWLNVEIRDRTFESCLFPRIPRGSPQIQIL
jgi:hypothetical protein